MNNPLITNDLLDFTSVVTVVWVWAMSQQYKKVVVLQKLRKSLTYGNSQKQVDNLVLTNNELNMETSNHFKNGARPKSLMSRKKE
jgi:hypothetical protein